MNRGRVSDLDTNVIKNISKMMKGHRELSQRDAVVSSLSQNHIRKLLQSQRFALSQFGVSIVAAVRYTADASVKQLNQQPSQSRCEHGKKKSTASSYLCRGLVSTCCLPKYLKLN